jgi:hypothetical protein
MVDRIAKALAKADDKVVAPDPTRPDAVPAPGACRTEDFDDPNRDHD